MSPSQLTDFCFPKHPVSPAPFIVTDTSIFVSSHLELFLLLPPLSLILPGRIKCSVLGLYFCNMVSVTILRYLVNLLPPPPPSLLGYILEGRTYIAYVKRHALSTLPRRYFRSSVIWARNSVLNIRLDQYLFFKYILSLFHVNKCLSTSLYEHRVHVSMQCSQELKEGVESPRTGVAEGYELPCEYWEPNLGPLCKNTDAFNWLAISQPQYIKISYHMHCDMENCKGFKLL